MKKIISLILVGLLLLSSMAAFADATPVLISIDTTNIKTLEATVISYVDHTLTIVAGDETLTILNEDDSLESKLSLLGTDNCVEVTIELINEQYYLRNITVAGGDFFCGTPTLYAADRFTTSQDGNQFTITLEENPSTGYTWTYIINDEEAVTFVNESYTTSEEMLLGAPGQKTFTFESTLKGVSTISFEYKRSFEEKAAETLEVLVYKTDDALFIEEDQIVTINNESSTLPEIELINVNDLLDSEAEMKLISFDDITVKFNETLINLDVPVQQLGQVTMVPLALTLREMGYTVSWNQEAQVVEIHKGAQWTSIKIGENAYFKNKMAAQTLSAAPIVVDGRTLVPAEFFSAILDLGMTVENGMVEFNEYPMGHYAGYVTSITNTDRGTITIGISYEKDGNEAVMIHTSNESTFYNKMIVKGTYVEVISSQVTTMSMPPQTSGYIIY